MKNFLKTTLLVASIIGTSISCDDYVDIEPLYSQDAENFFLTPADYDKALTGAYDLMQTSHLNLWISEIASDNAIAGGESVTDSEGLHQIDAMNHTAAVIELRSLWRYLYAGITRANYIFENKDKLEFNGKTKVLAQAAFLRAYYYFELVKFFGGVPLVVDKRLSAGEVKGQKRSTEAEVYAQIEKDLDFAAENLDWTDPVKGRVTKGAALSLLGKAYLYQEKFADAATTLDLVINQNQYSLVGNYANLFFVSSEGNTEAVFDIQYVGTEGGSYGCFPCLEGNAAVGFQGIRGYEGPIYGDGNSYNLPTADLVAAFEVDDPRLPASILDIEAFKNAQEDPTTVKYVQGGGGHTGYYNNKYIKRSNERGLPDDDLTSPLNHYVIRYSDVLLMAAEAHNRKPSPNDVLAKQYLKLVTDRAGRDEITDVGSALTEKIWAERRLEFAGEGHRWFDLVRTGKAATEVTGFQVGKNELFPIPQDEIDLVGGGADWQNQGY